MTIVKLSGRFPAGVLATRRALSSLGGRTTVWRSPLRPASSSCTLTTTSGGNGEGNRTSASRRVDAPAAPHARSMSLQQLVTLPLFVLHFILVAHLFGVFLLLLPFCKLVLTLCLLIIVIDIGGLRPLRRLRD